MGRAAEVVAPSSSIRTDGGCPVAQVNDLSRSVAEFDPMSSLGVVVEMSKAIWLVSGAVPGVERQPLKKLEPDATALLRLIERWRNEAVRAGRPISRIALAYEAGRDGFWLARWLIVRGVEAHVIHSARVAVSRERKRGKRDRLDAAMLMRGFLGWVGGGGGHCGMVRLLARVIGIGIETADMLVREVLSRKLRDRRAVARYAGLTGSPDESGLKRREKGLAKAGNARVRRGLIQLAWRFLMFQKDSALARWYRTRTEGPSGARKTTMIVALARKLLIALWRLVTTGEVPDGVELRPAA